MQRGRECLAALLPTIVPAVNYHFDDLTPEEQSFEQLLRRPAESLDTAAATHLLSLPRD